MEKQDYYDGREVRSKNADYTLVVGMRSNGKSYDFLGFCADEFIVHSKQFVYIRKSELETRTNRVNRAMANMEVYIRRKYGDFWRVRAYSGMIQMFTDGEKDYQTMGYVMNNSTWQSYKSNSYPNVSYILFDEFTAKQDAFSQLSGEDEVESFFQNVSTVVRNRTDVRIFMLGNTVSRETPFFKAFKIDAYRLKKGTITTYETDTGLKIAIEYCKDSEVASKSSKFFTFAKASKMITSGEWEVEPFRTEWQNNSWKEMVKWRSFQYWFKITRDNNENYFIGISRKREHPIIIMQDDEKQHKIVREYYSLKSALLYNRKLKELVRKHMLENNIVISDDKTSERWHYDLKKLN